LEACKAPYPFKAVHLVPVTILLLLVACQRFFPLSQTCRTC